MNIKSLISFVITPLVLMYVLFFVEIAADQAAVKPMLCVAILMAVWWVTEVVPLAVTSLIPVALFPLLGIMDGKDVSTAYFNDVIFLFMGGFLVALAMEKWMLHKRMALYVLAITGTSPARILLGFMLSSFLLSMWISNTATVMMLLPITLSLLNNMDAYYTKEDSNRFGAGLLLGVAYSASIGGIATLVGTPPNLSFVRIFHIYFPDAAEVSFAQWLVFAFPLSLSIFILVWAYLFIRFKPAANRNKIAEKNLFRQQLQQMGKMKYEERVVLLVFVLLALFWITRSNLAIGSFTIVGWSSFFPASKFINDGTVAIFMALLLFLIPSGNKNEKILDWATSSRLPWHILLLFGGGFALATGFKESGLALWFGNQLSAFTALPPIVVILMISLLVTFLTEVTSNTATTEMILPILAGIAIQNNLNPLLLMIPATLSASMAFMLPVATPPNAIIFGSSRISVAQMAKTGLFINLLAAVIITLATYYWGNIVFHLR